MTDNDVFAAWQETDPARKCARVAALVPPTVAPSLRDLPGRAGFPERPALIDPKAVPQRSLQSLAGRAALIHAIAHIEFNAINLALDAALRFGDLPIQYYADWVRVAQEEAVHFDLLQTHLKSTYGATYGDFDAHDGLWEMAARTADDVLARMALVPRVLEARGLDVTPSIIEKLKQAGDKRAVEILSVILHDEVEHVAIGNRWYGFFCAQRGVSPASHFTELQQRYRAPKLKPPFNVEARMRAGFTEAEISSWLN
jgi:uncharacterized ferritin-like protein (DUF455 family)